MLTRLKVSGFKNLHEVDLAFGPFTCIAGPNGVGKSNIFDAIAFLAALSEMPLIEAAASVRGGDTRRGDVRSLFRRTGDRSTRTMSFTAEMLIPPEGEDDLSQVAKASMTYLRYELELCYRPDTSLAATGALEIVREECRHINKADSRDSLGFDHKAAWRNTAVLGRRTSAYISTELEGGVPVVSLHTDSAGGLGGGRPRKVPAASLPRTMLSSASNATEHRTLVLARQEMSSWTQLQLEPSALRAPDGFTSPRTVGPNGEHLPGTLFELAQAAERDHPGGAEDTYAQVANRLSQLVEDVRRIAVEVDEKRQTLSIVMTDRLGTEHVAGALSDGTLRFLAMTVMEMDPKSRRLLCLEEPENGVHPLRIPAVLRLLEDLAVDTTLAVDDENPLRQIIVNTHSPSVVACIPDHALLVAQVSRIEDGEGEGTSIRLHPLSDTWRSRRRPEAPVASRSELLGYLNPLEMASEIAGSEGADESDRRVGDRPEYQQLFLPFVNSKATS